jgi:NitT/TauT family transport system ATP-binding protein
LGRSCTAAPALELRDVACTFISRDDPGQRYTAVADVSLTVGAGRVRLGGRPHRLRQEHAAERGRRAAAAQHRPRQVFGQPLQGINPAPATCSRPRA